MADRFRRGRLYLAGDAAHAYSPATGQGMNGGIQDAVNLGWKLAFAAARPGDERLLDSYDRERRPVAREVMAMTHIVFWAEASLGPVPSALRGRLAPLAAPLVPAVIGRRLVAEAVRLFSQLAVGYRHSPLSVEGTPRRGGGPRAGDRLPDRLVSSAGRAIRLHDLLARPGVHLLLDRDADPLGTLPPSPFVSIHRLTSSPGRGLIAVRPDGYIGFRGQTVEIGQLATWLGWLRAGAAPAGDVVTNGAHVRDLPPDPRDRFCKSKKRIIQSCLRKRVSAMSTLMRCTVLASVAGLIGLAGCGTVSANSPGEAKTPTPTASTTPPATSPSGTAMPRPAPPACPQSGSYLTAIKVGQHAGYDRVVFQFSGGRPAYGIDRVGTVYADPKGTPVALAGQSFLRVVFRGATAVCQPSLAKTYAGPSTLTPFYPQLLAVSAAGDFEGYLSFGIGLAARGTYHVSTMTGPYRVVIDVDHVALGAFPGIWPVTSWPRYWELQYSWNNGHQPWQADPAMVVQAWARSRWNGTPVVRQVDANTFKVTGAGGQVATVAGARPVTAPGPWVITTTTTGSA